MGKIKTDWKEQLKKLNKKKQERDDAVVSLKNKTANKNAERLANVILDYVLNHKPYMYNG